MPPGLTKMQPSSTVIATICPHVRGSVTWRSRTTHQFPVHAYEDMYGKFLPDADVGEWMARKKKREAELLKLRDAAGEAA